jgi:hypothetical protein
VLLAWNLLSLGAHFWKQDKEEAAAPAPAPAAAAAAEAAGAGPAPAGGRGAEVRGRGLLVLSAALMLFGLLMRIPWMLEALRHAVTIFLCLDIGIPVIFIVIVLAAYRRRPRALVIPAALEVLFVILLVAAGGSVGAREIAVPCALVFFIAMTASGRFSSNTPLLIAVAAPWLVMAAPMVFALRSFGPDKRGLALFALETTLYWAAYFAAAAALRPWRRPQTQPAGARPAFAPPPAPAAGPASGFAQPAKEYPLFTRGGACDVCSQPLAGKTAYSVPTPVFWASPKCRDCMVSGPGSAVPKMMGMDPEAAFQGIRARDASPESAVCEDCVHLFK